MRVSVRPDRQSLALRVGKETEPFGSACPTVLVVDANREFVQFLERLMSDAKWEVVMAGTAAEGRRLAARRKPHAALIDAALSDDRGVHLAAQLCRANPELRAIVMTGAELPAEENESCTRTGIPVLFKPFTLRDAMNLIHLELQERRFERPDDPPKAA